MPLILAQSFSKVIFLLSALGGSLCFCTSRLAARLPARIAALGKSAVSSIQWLCFIFILRTRWIPKQQGASAAVLCAHSTPPLPPPPPDADADADADEAVTDALFFTLFVCCLFARALFMYKVLSDEWKAVARLERCFERCPRPASTLRCPKSERLDY